MTHITLHAAVGWIGISLIFLAYWLNSHGKLTFDDVWYHGINIAGALFYGYDLWVRSTWEGVTLELIWISIAVSALVKRHRKRREPIQVTS